MMKVQAELLEAIGELRALTTGHMGYLSSFADPRRLIQISLQVIHRHKVAEKLGRDETISYKELSERCGLDEDDLLRTLRLAIAFHIFAEPRKDMVKHTAVSYLLVGPLVDQTMGYSCDEILMSGARVVDSITKFPGSQESTEAGFAISNGGKAVWDVFSQDEMRAKRLSDMLEWMQSVPAHSAEYLFRDLDWEPSDVPRVMVDIGGSQGAMGVQFLRYFPNIERIIVQDRPEVVATAKVPDDLVGRLEFAAHDMFSPQPVENADAYFMRSLLHDWPDKYAVKILQALVPALEDGNRIILNEICMPEPGTLSNYQMQFLYGYDLVMKTFFNSKERAAEGWAKLFRQADSKFQLKRIRHTPGASLAMIEFVWVSKTAS